MKVNEIVRVERLDEVAPAALTVPMMFSALIFALKAKSIYDIYNVLSEHGYDIDKMDDEKKLSLFVDFVVLFVPGGGRFANAAIMRMLPDWAKTRAIKLITEFLKEKGPELRKIRDLNRKKYGANPKKLAQKNKKTTAQYQAAGKQLAAEKLKDQVYTVVGGLALLPLAYEYYGKLDELDQQYSAHKSGDRSTELFANMDDTAAYKEYQKLRTKYIGELTIGITAALSRTPVVKKLDAFNRFIGKLAGGGLVGGLLKLPIGTVTKIAKVGGPALAVFMQTDEGQQFLSNSIIETIIGGIGSISSATLNLLAAGLDKAAGLAGVTTNIQGAVQGQAPSPNVKNAEELAKKYNTNRTPRDLEVSFDPNNTKIVSLGGITITDAQGFLLPGLEDKVQRTAKLAKDFNHPNPIELLNLQFK